MDLIPDLPNDVANECLIRVSYKQLPTVASICGGWKKQIESPEFRRQRKATSRAQRLLVVSQARVDPNGKQGNCKRLHNPVFRVTLLELDSGLWSELPPVPGFSDGLPMFCRLAAVGSNLVLMGGLDPVTFEVSSSVFVFDFVTATWRRGADMPGEQRSLFGCASDHSGTVYVAGGHDHRKNALRSAMAYNVKKDEWIRLPDMEKERDECKGIFHNGKFHVVGGYRTESQGRFERDVETFNTATRQWDPPQEDFLEMGTCPKTCAVGDDDADLYMCNGSEVVSRRDAAWQPMAKLPAEVSNVAHMTTWQEKLMVIGSGDSGGAHSAYMLDVKSCKWMKMETPDSFTGHVHHGSYLEI